jgi:hypothetical protein
MVDCSTITPATHVDDNHYHPLPPPQPPPPTPSCDVTQPPGFIINHIASDRFRPRSPNTPFKFLFYTPSTLNTILDSATPDVAPLPSASVICVVARPQVFGIKNNSGLTVKLQSVWALMDAGAKICLTGNLDILANAIDIPTLHGNITSNTLAAMFLLGKRC